MELVKISKFNLVICFEFKRLIESIELQQKFQSNKIAYQLALPDLQHILQEFTFSKSDWFSSA